jgi:DNA-binding transcriptional ArsR family regulator
MPARVAQRAALGREVIRSISLQEIDARPAHFTNQDFTYKLDFVMRDVLYLERVEQAEALLKPRRVDLLRRMAEERSCTELAVELGETPQRVYYHVKKLEAAGLVERVRERRVRGIVEGIYRARARSYWLSPRLVGDIGGRRNARDRLSLGFLLELAEQLGADVAALAQRGDAETPSLGLTGEVRLPRERRAAFLHDLQSTFEALLARHGGGEGEPFALALACYPKGDRP